MPYWVPAGWPGGSSVRLDRGGSELDSRLRHLSGSSHTNDSEIGTPVASLPGAWRYGVSAGIGRPSVGVP